MHDVIPSIRVDYIQSLENLSLMFKLYMVVGKRF